jgi:sigma-B regulation protein RsbU (phosphoserine phosphatase)
MHEQYERDGRNFCTAAFGFLSPASGGFTVTLAAGGHPAPLLIRADGTARYLAMPTGPLIGVWDDVTFAATTVSLNPGDTLLLYTDGITEARTSVPDARYGDEALRDLAASLAPASAASAVAAIIALLDRLGAGVEDDTAVLALGVPPEAGKPRTP